MKKKIFIACDTTKLSTINKIIKNTQIKELEIVYKFGLEFFNSKKGRKYISKINKNKKVWLDLKLLDIPNTVSAAIYSLSDLRNINYLTIHASGGFEMMKSAKKAAKKINKNLKILGVTVLTSFSETSIRNIGHTKSIKNLVLLQAKLAKKAGLDGIVCSGHESKIIRKTCKNMEIITPGIRLKGDNAQDQKRVVSPSQSFRNGATGIVIGRSLTRGNIQKNIEKLIQELK